MDSDGIDWGRYDRMSRPSWRGWSVGFIIFLAGYAVLFNSNTLPRFSLSPAQTSQNSISKPVPLGRTRMGWASLTDEQGTARKKSFADIITLGRKGMEAISVEEEEEIEPPMLNKPIADLVDAIKLATIRAGGPIFMDQEDTAKWKSANPCSSRDGLDIMFKRRKQSRDAKANREWGLVLREYSKLHRACLSKVGNLTNYFLAKNTSTGCKFAVADVLGGGLGNRMLTTTNTILYGILTQRVVLVPEVTHLTSIMCEPFLGSSWVLDTSQFNVLPWDKQYEHLWTDLDDVYRNLDNSWSGSASTSSNLKFYAAAMGIYQEQPGPRFFCNFEQAILAEVPWLFFGGCLYTIPKFFAIPSFRSTLEALFPDKMVLTHMLRSVMLPADDVWDWIMRVYAAHLKSADHQVGIQLRYRDGQEQYDRMNDLINMRVEDCAVQNGLLPATNLSKSQDKVLVHEFIAPVVTVFIASLFSGLHQHLTKTYLPRPTSTGEIVSLVQLTAAMTQERGVEVDALALVEIICLSFSDALIVTPMSTYGGIAQAYGALTPWFVEFRQDETELPCKRAQTVDVCYQLAYPIYSCRHDSDLHTQRISEVVPYLQKCLAIDARGSQLITNSDVFSPNLRIKSGAVD